MVSFKNQLIVGLAIATGAASVPAAAQTHKGHHVSPVVAGVAAYELAKHTGKKGHKNVLQRHPVLTGIGAAIIAHKHNKKVDRGH
jgi:hypothetical protein